MENKVIGIDISKQTFDVAFPMEGKWQHHRFPNNAKGFAALSALVGQGDWVVMEASGPYYLPLASCLYSEGARVVVENPLVIKRYAQMRLYRAKTDKKDARTISEYGASASGLARWEPDKAHIADLRHLQTAIEGLQKQVRQCKGQLEAFLSGGHLDRSLEREMRGVARFLEKKIGALEGRQMELARAHFPESLKKLMSVPAIGPKTAVVLLSLTDGFQKFDHYKKLIAYIGLSPRVYQSGTSVKGKGHICKMGNPQARKLLYMCAWSAKSCNGPCKQMYDRLAAKGKPERVIKIALAHKLVKQAFAIVKGDGMFDKKYQEKACF